MAQVDSTPAPNNDPIPDGPAEPTEEQKKRGVTSAGYPDKQHQNGYHNGRGNHNQDPPPAPGHEPPPDASPTTQRSIHLPGV
jgi:hypothetical protein